MVARMVTTKVASLVDHANTLNDRHSTFIEQLHRLLCWLLFFVQRNNKKQLTARCKLCFSSPNHHCMMLGNGCSLSKCHWQRSLSLAHCRTQLLLNCKTWLQVVSKNENKKNSWLESDTLQGSRHFKANVNVSPRTTHDWLGTGENCAVLAHFWPSSLHWAAAITPAMKSRHNTIDLVADGNV